MENIKISKGTWNTPSCKIYIDNIKMSEKSTHSACWSYIHGIKQNNINNKIEIYLNLQWIKEDYKMLNEYQFLKLIRALNKFLPMKIVYLDGIKHLKVELKYKKYNMNLYFLNILRLYWHSPIRHDEAIFADLLNKLVVHRDKNKLLKKLTEIQCLSVPNKNFTYPPGHSNIHKTMCIFDYDHFMSFENKEITSISQFYE